MNQTFHTTKLGHAMNELIHKFNVFTKIVQKGKLHGSDKNINSLNVDFMN